MNRSAEVNSGLIAVQYPAVQYPSETLLSRLLAFVLWSAGSTMKENTSGNVNSGSRQDLPWTLLMRIWHECRNGNRFVGSRQKKTLRIVESYTGVRRDSNPVLTTCLKKALIVLEIPKSTTLLGRAQAGFCKSQTFVLT